MKSVKISQSQLSVTFLAFITLLLAGCVTVESPDSLERNKDPDKALKTYVTLGVRYLQQRNMEDAARTLKRAYDIDPDDAEVNNALALFYTVENEPEQVQKHYEAALKEDPEFSTARNNYAAFLFRQKRYEEALEQLKVAVKDYRYTRRYQSFENMGFCYLQLGDDKAAEKAFKRALQLNPRLPRSLMEMADISFTKGDHQSTDFYVKQLDKLPLKPTARQLWLEIQLSRVQGDQNKLASLELALKNLFPLSPEYKMYQESLSERGVEKKPSE